MGVNTAIQWCDSTLNLEAGCDGCELWTPTVRRCYAGTMTERYGGSNKGWPRVFTEPQLYLDRLDAAEKWPDLNGKDREDKPWLNGMPRMIFLNDLGDTFTESLPLNWMEPLLPRMEAMPVIWMCLSKRVNRMAEFGKACGFPSNFWLMTSVTSEATMKRVTQLLGIPGDYVRSVSAEPLLEPLDFQNINQGTFDALTGRDFECLTEDHTPALDGLIIGGESGPGARPCDLAWIRSIVKQCKAANTAAFVKQVGSRPYSEMQGYGDSFSRNWFKLKSSKGGNPEEWPEDLRVREMPGVQRS